MLFSAAKRLRPTLIFIVFLVPRVVSAGGLWLYEGATPEMGTAGAGRGAIAENAAIAAFNPAGMTRIKGDQIMTGIQPMYVDAQFSGEASNLLGNTESGSNGGNAGGLIPSLAFYYVNSYSDRLKFGFSSVSYFGLGVDYGESWKGRYFTTEASMLTLALSPTMAYKVNDSFSIGVGAGLLYSDLKQSIIKRSDESRFKLESNDWGYNFNLSFLYEPTEKTRFGLVYVSSVDFDFKNVGPNDKANLEMSTPQSLTLSAYHELNEKWTILSSVGWQEWSDFGSADIETDNQTIDFDRNFDDIYHISFGAHYKYSTPITLMAGVAYDSSPVEDKYRTIDMPLDRQIRYALGGTYQYSNKITLGMAYELMDAGDGKVNQKGSADSSITGKFVTNYVHMINLNINYIF